MSQGLPSYLAKVAEQSPGDVISVSREMDPAFEITAAVVKLEREARRRPVLTFENVKGSTFPVLTNLHASRSRLALAIDAEPRRMLEKYAMEKPIPPRVVESGPSQDVVLEGDAVDLLWNCAYNRLMITGRNSTSIHLTLGKHLWEYYQIAESRGEPLPVAFAIGVHPAIALGCLAIGSIDEDERAIMGGLFGEPLELVRCKTSDLLAPAHAEIILETEIMPGERIEEGPFGEFTGYSLGARDREVVRVNAMTHREGAVYQDISVGHLDHLLLSTIPMEANLYRAVRAMIPSVRQVRVPSPFTCYVAIEQRLTGQAKNAILAVLGADLYIKRVVVVDHDVDVFDDRQVNWAIATRCQPDRDITIITNARGSDLDPSTAGHDGNTSKWGVDATAKPSLAEFTPRHSFPAGVMEGIDLDDILPPSS
jgi:3-polyprenyl-4-hydroxybenzoate decarboxylase